MKLIKPFILAAITTAAMFGFSSCNNDNTPSEAIFQIGFNPEQLTFTPEDYWTGCYEPSAGNITSGMFSFRHNAWVMEWDGISYPGWNGFCPSRVNDNANHKNDWTDHQWACMPANFEKGVYLVGNSEAAVNENPLLNNKCSVSMTSMGYFNPKYVFVTNSSYVYYAAKEGTQFNDPFTQTDNFVLNVVGVRDGKMTGHLKFGLIANGQYLTDWAFINLEQLGTVDEVLFYVDSTQKSLEYGLNIPSYFCMTGFGFSLPSSTEQ